MDQDQLAEIVKEIEDEQALGKISAVEVFKGMLNQPELLSISSANAQQTGPSYAYSQFSINMPRPILEADTLQLLAANIPLCTQNFPDTACAFWYYRLDKYAGPVPNTENLFFIRLLPSYYKPEFIGTTYGYNVTFSTYQDVAVQLAKACVNDLAYNNIKQQAAEELNTYQLQYIPSDISITYDTTQNKFQMTGLNATAPLFAYSVADTYAGGTTYAVGAFVTYNSTVWRSLQSGNVGHSPLTSPTWWAFVTDKLVRNWEQGTSYRAGQYVYAPTYTPPSLFVTSLDFYASTPNFNGGGAWTIPTATNNFTYLVTGYADPNVAINQNGGQFSDPTQPERRWNPYALFEKNDLVEYENQTYKARFQNKGWLPFQTASATVYNTSKTDYKVGAVVYNSATLLPYWKCIANNPPANNITANPFTCATYWIPSYWIPDFTDPGPVVGLRYISSQFDMLDYITVAGTQYVEYPFPVDVPGQPINPAPRRLLNSLLGFCWNGIFNPVAVSQTFSTGSEPYIATSGDTVDLLNRIRPVPPYYRRLVASAPALGTSQATLTTTYTADGYANLVYSSIVSIYSTIVYGSTLDSQRNTNLIGLSSMNAGNLGVSFFDNKINGPLRVKGADIYSIGIELRDEMNEPYPITNNGVCTFTLKLTYKEKSGSK